MNLILLTCSKSKNDFLKSGESEYFQRINQFAKIQLVEITVPEKIVKLPEQQRVEREAELILAKIKADGFIIALDEKARTISSAAFAALIDKEFTSGCRTIYFIIGGPYGLSQAVLSAAHLKLSLSELTFTAQLARMILAEQIYRALSIIKNLPYHKI